MFLISSLASINSYLDIPGTLDLLDLLVLLVVLLVFGPGQLETEQLGLRVLCFPLVRLRTVELSESPDLSDTLPEGRFVDRLVKQEPLEKRFVLSVVLEKLVSDLMELPVKPGFGSKALPEIPELPESQTDTVVSEFALLVELEKPELLELPELFFSGAVGATGVLNGQFGQFGHGVADT